LDFSASLNPLGPPQSVLQALARALSASDPVAISRYPDPDYRELRACLAQRWAVDPEWIFVGNGAAELLTWRPAMPRDGRFGCPGRLLGTMSGPCGRRV